MGSGHTCQVLGGHRPHLVGVRLGVGVGVRDRVRVGGRVGVGVGIGVRDRVRVGVRVTHLDLLAELP